ncbi:MAG: hypothetical protein ACREQJ_15105, partial [Candidatus Binatia bacterium]
MRSTARDAVLRKFPPVRDISGASRRYFWRFAEVSRGLQSSTIAREKPKPKVPMKDPSTADVARATNAQSDAGRVIERVLARLGELPGAAALEPMRAAEIVTRCVDDLYAMLGEERTSTPSRSVPGMTPQVLFMMHHLALEEVCGSLRDRALREPTPRMKQALATATLDLFLRATKDFRAAFLEENRRAPAARSADEMSAFLDALFGEAEAGEIEKQARALGFDLRGSFVALAFQAHGAGQIDGDGLWSHARTILRAIRAGNARVGRSGPSVIAFLVGEPDWRALASAVGSRAEVMVGAGLAATGAVGLRRTSHEASRALALARGAATP